MKWIALLALVAGCHAPRGTAPETGSVEGTIFVWDDEAHTSQHPLDDAVVALTQYTGPVPEPGPAKRIVFTDDGFSMRTVTMTYGQRLEIVNASDRVLGPSFDQAPMPALMVAPPRGNGDPLSLHPPHPGYFTLRDRMGNDGVRLDVYVLLHPLHAVSAGGGRYRIDGVPPGPMTVNARVAGLGEASATVQVASGTTRMDLHLEYRPKITRAPASTRVIP
ncbi:carboxypeptidase-like regulatory domain-containing protein [Pendulispora brunnea]|uniref:Carboxypeptidase-like regulatory domain-containing protein n=1 Tax=Pendulispora brunnea TaxID=2905690 RepID=A0ABZ2K2M6_9BACT